MNKKILRLGFKPLSFLNKIKRKDEKLIFFYSNLGFRDNVKAFYDYLIEKEYNKKYKIVVSTNDFENYLGKQPANVEFTSNKQGISVFMKSRYAFYCFGKYPIKPSKKQTVVNLWHGTPLKKIGNLESGCEKIDYNYFSTVITSGEIYRPIMMKVFGCKKSQVEVFGYPRNDEMFRANNIVDTSIRRGSNKVILWLPTYREYDTDFLVSILRPESLKELNDYLKKNNSRIIIKLHPLQSADISKIKYPYIEFLDQEKINKAKISVYSLLRNADGLITDYSSVYYDYMLLNRQIAFAVEDIDRYKEERGFVFDNPEEYMPGMTVKTIEDVKQFINNVIDNDDKYKEKREEINDLINYYQDGNNCKRIAERFIK